MANSQIAVTEGSGKNIASYSFSESTTKELQRTVLNNSSGTELGGATTPIVATAVGDIAHDAADSGNPLKFGGIARITNPTAVADADRVNAIFDKLGKQIVVGAIRDMKGVQQTTITSSTAETTIISSVASTFLDLYGIIVANTSASAASVTVKDATAGTTRFILYVPAGETRGFTLPVDSAIPQAAVTNNWTATCTSVASLQITALYVKNL